MWLVVRCSYNHCLHLFLFDSWVGIVMIEFELFENWSNFSTGTYPVCDRKLWDWNCLVFYLLVRDCCSTTLIASFFCIHMLVLSINWNNYIVAIVASSCVDCHPLRLIFRLENIIIRIIQLSVSLINPSFLQLCISWESGVFLILIAFGSA